MNSQYFSSTSSSETSSDDESPSPVASKPTPIPNPMTANVASKAALQEASTQHDKLRREKHPEFSSNVFGGQDRLSLTTTKHEERSKKRKRVQSTEQDDGAMDGNAFKKSKSDGKNVLSPPSTTATASNFDAEGTRLLNDVKTLLPPPLLLSALNSMQQKAEKSHKAKATAAAPTSIDDSTVILTATRDALKLLGAKRLGISILSSDHPRASQGSDDIGQGSQITLQPRPGVAANMEAELGRIAVEKTREVERLEQENAFLKDMVGRLR